MFQYLSFLISALCLTMTLLGCKPQIDSDSSAKTVGVKGSNGKTLAVASFDTQRQRYVIAKCDPRYEVNKKTKCEVVGQPVEFTEGEFDEAIRKVLFAKGVFDTTTKKKVAVYFININNQAKIAQALDDIDYLKSQLANADGGEKADLQTRIKEIHSVLKRLEGGTPGLSEATKQIDAVKSKIKDGSFIMIEPKDTDEAMVFNIVYMTAFPIAVKKAAFKSYTDAVIAKMLVGRDSTVAGVLGVDIRPGYSIYSKYSLKIGLCTIVADRGTQSSVDISSWHVTVYDYGGKKLEIPFEDEFNASDFRKAFEHFQKIIKPGVQEFRKRVESGKCG